MQRCATTLREVSSAAAFYQAMRSERTVPAVMVCTIAELPEFSCVSISAVIQLISTYKELCLFAPVCC